MRKHIVDQGKSANTSGMLDAFTRIHLSGKPHSATLAVQRQPRRRSEDGRIVAYTRIDRGYPV